MLRTISGYKRTGRMNIDKLRTKMKILSVNHMACYHILTETFNVIKKGASEKIRSQIVSNMNKSYSLRSSVNGDLSVNLRPKDNCT